jgi:hypothetical protein
VKEQSLIELNIIEEKEVVGGYDIPKGDVMIASVDTESNNFSKCKQLFCFLNLLT